MNPLLAALFGGVLIGLASVLVLVCQGHVAGVSGIAGRTLAGRMGIGGWRLAFLLGLLAGGVGLAYGFPASLGGGIGNPVTVGIAGLLVGVGSRLGNGCTSGHGVCGISRGSVRAIVATTVFIAVGMVVATAAA